MNNLPVPQQSNNGVLSSTHAMPMKILTSDNDSTFGMNRMLFQRSYINSLNYSQQKQGTSIIQRQSPAIQHGFILDGGRTVNQKKWIGGNRDASDIISRRRINSSGAVLNTVGNQSFKNPNDNNPRIDALARVRGGGYRVPPKVTNRPVYSTSTPNYYRIISAGLSAIINDGIVNVLTSTANGISPGFYSYTPTNTSGTALANVLPLNNFGRSYNVLTIDRKTGITTIEKYDVFVGYSQSLIDALNALTSSVIVIISTYDEPQTSGENTPTTNYPLSTDLVNAIKRCGASNDFGSANSGIVTSPLSSYDGIIHYRGAYVLVGIPGIGVGNGLQRYVGNSIVDGDPNAVIDLRISVFNGEYTYISG
jgi:hypothetical protein